MATIIIALIAFLFGLGVGAFLVAKYVDKIENWAFGKRG